MARVPYVDTDRTPQTRRVADEIRANRAGELPNLYHALLQSPPVCEGWLRLGTALRSESGLEPRLRELVTCLVAAQTASGYEWAHHSALARREGVTDHELAALAGDLEQGLFDDDELACLEFARAVVHDETAADELFAQVRTCLGDSGTVELAALAAYYSGVARFLKVLDVEVEDIRSEID
jgi:AhpD family alkylhydroperoxidase